MLILWVLKIFLQCVLAFVLLSYTIYLYEKSNVDNLQVKRLVNTANLWLSIRIIAVEFVSLLLSIILWPFGFLNLPEMKAESGKHKPILLLHGLFLNRSCWTVMKLRFRLAGIRNLHTLNLPPTSDVETVTEKVALKVDSLRHAHKCDTVDLIGHSMGGIIARNYVQLRGGAGKVARCITIGSPHRGSKLSPFAVMKLSEAIMPKSAFLENLNAAEIPEQVRLINIYSRHDNLVIPYDNAILDKAHNIEVAATGHNSLLYSGTVFRHLLSALETSQYENDTDQQPQES